MKYQIFSTGVFERSGRDQVPPEAFYGGSASLLIWGLSSTAVVAYMTTQAGYNPGWAAMLILGLAIPIAGIFVVVKSDNLIVSFLGYNMICISFGVILAPTLQQYSENVVMNPFGITAFITFVMGFARTLSPKFFNRLGPVLMLSLFGLLLVMIAQIFIPALRLGVIDYIGAGIFSLYIGYDMYRANHMQKTIDNAIDLS